MAQPPSLKTEGTGLAAIFGIVLQSRSLHAPKRLALARQAKSEVAPPVGRRSTRLKLISAECFSYLDR